MFSTGLREFNILIGESMRKIIAIIALLVLFTVAAMADTLYLKNGSVLKGNFIGYENGVFIFEINNGNRLKLRPSEVLKLVIERDTVADNRPVPDAGNPNRPNWENFPAVDVKLEEQWYRTRINLMRGQRVRVSSTGTITLDGRTQTGPEGLSGKRDPDAPMPDQNDGGLVAVIGQDPNAPMIFIGRSNEFVADRDGVLYFTVNHWETRDARGSFRVNVSADRNLSSVPVGPDSGNVGQVPSRGSEKTVTVPSTQQWTDTGIDLEPNMTLDIVAEGNIELSSRYRSTPDGNRDVIANTASFPLQGEGAGALVAKIRYRDGRESNVVLIGSRSTPKTEQGEYGRLFLGINDDFLRDNKGSYTVRIRW